MLINVRPDILVLGFQEIVPLTAQQIVQTDPEKRLVLSSHLESISLIMYVGGFGRKKLWITLNANLEESLAMFS